MRGIQLCLLGTTIVIAACARPGPALTPAAPPTPTATPIPQVVKDIADEVPFDIVLPTFLPHGIELTNATVHRPPALLDEEGRRRNTRVELHFGKADGTTSLILTESIAVPHIGSPGAQPIAIGGVDGEILEGILEANQVRFLSLTWPGDGIGYALMAFMAGELSREEVIRIAESTLTNRH